MIRAGARAGGDVDLGPPRHGQIEPSVRANPVSDHEQPVVVPHVMHLRQVPLRTMVNWPHSPHGSPS